MRRPSGKIPAQPLTHMWERHHEIKRRLVLGERQCDIARDMGMTDVRMSVIANSPLMRGSVEELRARADDKVVEIQERLMLLRKDAVEAMAEIVQKRVEPGNAALRIKVAESILDRTGHGKAAETKNEVNITLEQYVQQTLNQLNATGNPCQLHESTCQLGD